MSVRCSGFSLYRRCWGRDKFFSPEIVQKSQAHPPSLLPPPVTTQICFRIIFETKLLFTAVNTTYVTTVREFVRLESSSIYLESNFIRSNRKIKKKKNSMITFVKRYFMSILRIFRFVHLFSNGITTGKPYR